jgi:hypothetical protein
VNESAAPHILVPIDEYSAATTPIDLFFLETKLASGTAFVWQSDRHYLITNWHNVTGKNPFTGAHLSSHAGEPNNVGVYFNTPGPSPDRRFVKFHLRDSENRPNWFVHPQHGKSVDVVAIPINLPDQVAAHPINRMTALNDLDVQIGNGRLCIGLSAR